MKKYISALLIGASMAGLTSCHDYLNEQPESALTPEKFFATADQLGAYTINLYGNFPVHDQYT